MTHMIVGANPTVSKTASEELREARQYADTADHSYDGDADSQKFI